MASARHDPYGRPGPRLAPAPELESRRNTELRAYLARILEEEWRWVFRRGVFVHLTIHLQIADGTLQPELDVMVQRHHDYEREKPR